MAYKQNNPLSRKSSPLKHNVVDARSGEPYFHRHGYGSRSNQFRGVQGTQVEGNPNFNTNVSRTFREDGEKFKAKDMNLEYLQNIANIYNQGGFAPGSTFTGGTYYNRANRKPSQGLNVFGLNFSTPQRGSTGVRDKLVIKAPGRSKGIQGQGMYGLGDNWVMNEESGQWDFTGDPSTLQAPEQQYTAEQLYDIMSSGDGMMQYVEGIGFVGGNPGETRHDISREYDDRYHHGFTGGNWEYATDSEWSSGENMPWLQAADQYDPNKPYDPNAVVEEVVEETPKKMTIADILAARKQQQSGPSRKSSKEEPFYRRSSKSSPLNQVDPRSGPLEGYEYGEGVVGEKVPVYDDAGTLIGYNTPTTFSGTMNVPGVEEVPGTYDPGAPGGSPNPPGDPNPDNLPQEELDRRFTNFCLENPTDPRCQGFNERMGITLPPVEVPTNEVVSDQYTTTAFEPYIEEQIIEDPAPPVFSIGTQGVGKRTGGKVKIKLPEIDLGSINPLNIVKMVGNTVFTKSGKCKAGCATNPNS